MKKAAFKKILDFYGVENSTELLYNEEVTNMLHDCVVDAFCSECGEYSGAYEPDASDIECDCCGKEKVASLGVLIGII